MISSAPVPAVTRSGAMEITCPGTPLNSASAFARQIVNRIPFTSVNAPG